LRADQEPIPRVHNSPGGCIGETGHGGAIGGTWGSSSLLTIAAVAQAQAREQAGHGDRGLVVVVLPYPAEPERLAFVKRLTGPPDQHPRIIVTTIQALLTLLDRDVASYFQSLEHLLRYCVRPPFALERLSVIRGAAGRIPKVRRVPPRHKAANWVGPGRGRKSTRPGASSCRCTFDRPGTHQSATSPDPLATHRPENG
jgi:hypothetical protein